MEETSLQTYLTNRTRIDASAVKLDEIFSRASVGKSIVSHDADGHPHVYVTGVLTPNGPDIFDRIMGVEGTSYKQIISTLYDVHEALDDSAAPIFLHVDSPGGTVRGAEATAAAVADIAGQRPVIAVNQGVMASAALWVASGATDIVSDGRSTLTGSVGALATVVKYEDDGLQIYNFVNPESPNKIPDPATDEGAKVFVDRVSGIYSIFRDDLVAGRKGRTSVERVESLKGAVVTASEAMKVGLIDRIVGKSDSLYTPAAKAGNEDGSATIGARDREDNMNLSEFLKEHPEAKAELDARISQARSEGEKAAADRHAEVVAKLKPFMDGEYPERVKTACADAISGIRSVESVLDLVAIFDEIKASQQGRDSDVEQDDMPETPASGPEVRSKVDDAAKRDSEWNEAIKGLLG